MSILRNNVHLYSEMTSKVENCPHLCHQNVRMLVRVRTLERADGQTNGGTDSYFSQTLLKRFISIWKGCYITHFVADTAARNATKVKNAVCFLWLWFYGPLKIISLISRWAKTGVPGEKTPGLGVSRLVNRARRESRNAIHSPFSYQSSLRYTWDNHGKVVNPQSRK